MKELELINNNLSQEDRVKANIELSKSETQQILDGINERKNELDEKKATLLEEKRLREEDLANEIATLEASKEAKRLEALAEGETLRELIATKNTLEQSYLDAFGTRISEEESKVESLRKKYIALAKAKQQA